MRALGTRTPRIAGAFRAALNQSAAGLPDFAHHFHAAAAQTALQLTTGIARQIGGADGEAIPTLEEKTTHDLRLPRA